MLVLIDKFGCSGFKLTKGSTPYLIIGMIIFKDHLEAEKVGNVVNELRKQLSIHSEFKFNKTSFRIMEVFFSTLCQYDFEIRVLMADKVGMDDPGLRKSSKLFYEYLIETLIKNNEDLLLNASIKINKNVDKLFQRILKRHLQEKKEQKVLKKFQFCNLKEDSLIQFGDMLIGIISKTYSDESISSQKLFNLLVESKKIKFIWKLRESSNTLH